MLRIFIALAVWLMGLTAPVQADMLTEAGRFETGDSKTAVDLVRAESLYRQAAETGQSRSLTALACFLYRQDKPVVARSVLERAAKLGDIEATVHLAKFQHEGVGGEKLLFDAMSSVRRAAEALKSGTYHFPARSGGAPTFAKRQMNPGKMTELGTTWLTSATCGPTRAAEVLMLFFEDMANPKQKSKEGARYLN